MAVARQCTVRCMGLVVRGTIFQTPTRERLEVLVDHVVTVGDDGVIAYVGPGADHVGAIDVVLGDDDYLLPGLIDLHVHAPQWPQLGTGLDLPLEDWLFSYTFPLESRYVDLEFARRVWESMVPRLLREGTTTAVYFSSIHEPATLALAQVCLTAGQRGFVGRVAMDHPEGTPDFYRDADAGDAVERSHRSITAIEALDPSGLVRPIITPRFIPACTDAALEGLGELAEATGALVQTHCSESDWEHGYVLDRFGVTDTVALERFGLARDHSVLAHADHVTHSDQQVLAGLGAGIAHCPLSNSYFANAVLPVRQVLDNGVRLGLGTDVAGGPDASILASSGHAVTVSRMLEDGVDPVVAAHDRATPDSRIDVVTAFYLATVGGAEVLGLNAGLLEHGRVFDAFVVQTGTGRSVEVWPEVDDDGRIFEKVVRGARGTDVSTVWVNGQTVVDAD